MTMALGLLIMAAMPIFPRRMGQRIGWRIK